MVATNDQKLGCKAPGSGFGYPVLGGVRIFGTTLVGLTSEGFAAPIQHEDVIAFAGVSEERIDNRDGSNGHETVETERPCLNWPVENADISNIGDVVYAADDNTLQLAESNGALAVGEIRAIDAEGIWVQF